MLRRWSVILLVRFLGNALLLLLLNVHRYAKHCEKFQLFPIFKRNRISREAPRGLHPNRLTWLGIERASLGNFRSRWSKQL